MLESASWAGVKYRACHAANPVAAGVVGAFGVVLELDPDELPEPLEAPELEPLELPEVEPELLEPVLELLEPELADDEEELVVALSVLE
jgi:hypothetical protein